MGYNLTNEAIQNTYQQLVQVSGSTLLDGTGSAISVSFPSASYADYAVTASYALNGGGTTIDTGSLVTTSSFNAYTSSNDASVASKLPTSTFNTYTSSVDSSLAGKLSVSTFNAYTSSNDSVVDALVAATSSYLTSLPSGVVSSSAQTVANLVGQNVSVQTLSAVSASIGYLQTVTGSATIIGDAFIILNNSTPTQPKGGISVVDTGSTATTSSFLWDGINDDWIYEYHLGGDHEMAVALFGSGSSIGSPAYPSNNVLQKGTGGHHLHDSNITDNGTTIGITGNLDMNSGGKIVLSDWTGSLHSTSILIGQTSNNPTLVNTLGQKNVQIGTNVRIVESSQRDNVVAIGGDISAAQGTVSIGHSIGNNTDSGIAIGNSINVTGNNEINIGGIFKYDGSSLVTLNSNVSASGNFTANGQISTPTFAGSIASATSSIDFDNGNFATLNCASSTFLANPSNLKSGTTYTIIITNGANISGYGTTYKFAGGTAPTLSAGTDVLTMVSDGTSLYATALADFQ